MLTVAPLTKNTWLFTPLCVAVPAMFSVRPVRLWPKPLIFRVVVAGIVVVPVPLIVPAVQLNTPLTIRAPAPEIVLLRLRVLAVDAVAISSDPPEIVRVPSLVRLLMLCAPAESVTLNATPMHASSVGPGTPAGLQLPAVCHRPSPAAPVQVSVHAADERLGSARIIARMKVTKSRRRMQSSAKPT